MKLTDVGNESVQPGESGVFLLVATTVRPPECCYLSSYHNSFPASSLLLRPPLWLDTGTAPLEERQPHNAETQQSKTARLGDAARFNRHIGAEHRYIGDLEP